MPPTENNNADNKPNITLNTNYFGTDGVIITENPTAAPKNTKFNLGVMITVLAFLVLSSVAYAYFGGIGFFSRPPYNENNLMSGLISKFPDIKSASYKVSIDFYTTDRDADAMAFDGSSDIDVENNLKYSRDYKRSQDVKNILSQLSTYKYSDLNYPSNLTAVKNEQSQTYSYEKISIIDPLTKSEYKYNTTNEGKDFVLEVEFETSSAISEILKASRYSDENERVVITEKTAKFSKDTYSYFYLPNRPPKSFFESMNEFSAMIPVDINVNGAISGASNWRENNSSVDWKFNIAGQGDFGDLTYKVSVDINRKDKNYFARINNFPSLMFFSQIPKREWIKLNPEEDEKGTYNSFFPNINEIEEGIVGSKDELIKFIKKFAMTADEESLYVFRNKPRSERINGRMLYKYDLKIEKESIMPFYKKIIEELYKGEYDSIDDLTLRAESADVLTYLESKDFDDIFDYFDKNAKNILWVEPNGNPAVYEFTFRIVPPEANLPLKDKQIMLTYKIELNDINKPVTVEHPESFKTLEEIMGSMLGGSKKNNDSFEVMSSLRNIKSIAELFYDDNLAYGTKAFSLGECKTTVGTLFEDPEIQSELFRIREKKSIPKCVSTSVSGKVTSYAVSATLPDDSGYSYCVDSGGFAGEIFGELSGISCSDLE